jgi:hypothetical protein
MTTAVGVLPAVYGDSLKPPTLPPELRLNPDIDADPAFVTYIRTGPPLPLSPPPQAVAININMMATNKIQRLFISAILAILRKPGCAPHPEVIRISSEAIVYRSRVETNRKPDKLKHWAQKFE